MTKAEIRNMVEDDVKSQFDAGNSIDEICADIFGNYSDIKITQVEGLVRQIGKDEGFIVSAKVKREQAIEFIEKDTWSFGEVPSAEDYQWRLDKMRSFGVTETWAKKELKDRYEAEGISFTFKKVKRSGWRLALAVALRDTPDMQDEGLVQIVLDHVKSEKVAEDYVRDYAWMIRVAMAN